MQFSQFFSVIVFAATSASAAALPTDPVLQNAIAEIQTLHPEAAADVILAAAQGYVQAVSAVNGTAAKTSRSVTPAARGDNKDSDTCCTGCDSCLSAVVTHGWCCIV